MVLILTLWCTTLAKKAYIMQMYLPVISLDRGSKAWPTNATIQKRAQIWERKSPFGVELGFCN